MARTEFIKNKNKTRPKNKQTGSSLQAGVAPFKAEATSVRGVGL
jgi:hypothetical protein